ncbi:hypothetical protein K502DRAFT_325659 [Neoconidiobolus thromboides FSU 785]|nr:hypothetical protein K502DRAFT_325659 [Neoconidiobolus thromboides FSU 785]
MINSDNSDRQDVLDKPTRQRKVLDIKTKKSIIELSKQGLSHQTIATRYSIGRSTVTKILLNKEHILENSIEHFHDFRKRIRKTVYDGLETELFKWCTEGVSIPNHKVYYSCSNRNEKRNVLNPNIINVREGVDKDMILWKAECLAKDMNLNDFVANNTWLGKFKRKYYLNFKTAKRRTYLNDGFSIKELTKECNPIAYRPPTEIQSRKVLVKSNVPQNVDLFNLSKDYKTKNSSFSVSNLLNPAIPVLKVGASNDKVDDASEVSPPESGTSSAQSAPVFEPKHSPEVIIHTALIEKRKLGGLVDNEHSQKRKPIHRTEEDFLKNFFPTNVESKSKSVVTPEAKNRNMFY